MGLLEVIGGVLLFVGLLTGVVAVLFAVEMTGAFIILNVSAAVVVKGFLRTMSLVCYLCQYSCWSFPYV